MDEPIIYEVTVVRDCDLDANPNRVFLVTKADDFSDAIGQAVDRWHTTEPGGGSIRKVIVVPRTNATVV